jgi:hypothetical protein
MQKLAVRPATIPFNECSHTYTVKEENKQSVSGHRLFNKIDQLISRLPIDAITRNVCTDQFYQW